MSLLSRLYHDVRGDNKKKPKRPPDWLINAANAAGSPINPPGQHGASGSWSGGLGTADAQAAAKKADSAAAAKKALDANDASLVRGQQSLGDWRNQMLQQLIGNDLQPLDQGQFTAPYDQAEQNLAGAYGAAHTAIQGQIPDVQQQFAAMQAQAQQQQAATQAGIQQRFTQTQANTQPQVDATVHDLQAQGAGAAPVQAQAALQTQALAGANAAQDAYARNIAQVQNNSMATRAQEATGLVNAALASLDANKAGAEGRIATGRANALSQLAQMQESRANALTDRKLKAVDAITAADQYTSPSEGVRSLLDSNPSDKTVQTAKAYIDAIDGGTNSLEDTLSHLKSDTATRTKLKSAGIDYNRVAQIIRDAYNTTAKKKQATLDQVRSGLYG